MSRYTPRTFTHIYADEGWVENELVPLLVTAYGKRPPGFWKEGVRQATLQLHNLPIYEDFDSTVERFRLLLVNNEILTRAEIKDFGWMRENIKTCIGVFVRHAINHGPYRLSSLGTAPDPDHQRPKDVHDSYIFCGKLAMRRPDQFVKKQGKPYWPQDDVKTEPLVGEKVEKLAPKVESLPLSHGARNKSPKAKNEPHSSHLPSHIENQPVLSAGSTALSSEMRLAWRPCRLTYASNDTNVREHSKKPFSHTKPKPLSRPVHVARGPASQRNGRSPFYASRQHQRPQGKMPPRNGYGAPNAYQPWGITPPAIPPSMSATISPVVGPTMTAAIPLSSAPMYLNNPYNYAALPRVNGGYHMPYPPHGTFVTLPQAGGAYHMPYLTDSTFTPVPQAVYGYHLPHSHQGNFSPVPQIGGGYQMPYSPQSNFVPVPQVDGSSDTRSAYSAIQESSSAALEVTAAVFQPGARAHHLRMDANEVVSGANGHSF